MIEIGRIIDRTGEIKINKQGLKMKIINYKCNSNIDIQFEDGYISYNKEYKSFRKGNINNPNYDYCKKKSRLGETVILKCGATAKIINYKDANNIKIKILETEEIIDTCYKNFKCRNIKSKFLPSVYNHGYLGYEETIDKDGNQLPSYKTWSRMLERCYSEKYKEKQPTYKDVICCKEWLNYSNFKKWYNENYYEIEGEQMALDKDILIKGNKVYSPENCVFVPQRINSLFVKNDANRNNLIGVYYDDSKNYINKYKVSISVNNKIKYIGRFNTPEEAFNAYKQFKEQYIKQIADEYKDKIPKKLYDAMYRYKVEITD